MSLPATGSEVRLVVETPSGTFVRTVQAATPLAPSATQGRSAEQATESAAARLGLPDFVFSADLVNRGSGTRELGDVLLVVGSHGTCRSRVDRAPASHKPEKSVGYASQSPKRLAKRPERCAPFVEIRCSCRSARKATQDRRCERGVDCCRHRGPRIASGWFRA